MKTKKLQLSTETLRHLETADLDGVHGGTWGSLIKPIVGASKKYCTNLLTLSCDKVVQSLKNCGGPSYNGEPNVSVGPSMCTA